MNQTDELRGLPREQYERTYVLLPPTASLAWARAVVEGTWDDKRYTIGGSADDAGIGDLDVRRIVAVNPGDWGDDLGAFFEKYYPGITYLPLVAATPAELWTRLRAGPRELCQTWSEWRAKRFGALDCTYTIGQQGCYVTGLAWAQRKLGVDADATPVSVDAALGHDGYRRCLALWSASRVKLGMTIRGGTDADVEAHLRQGLPVLARVTDFMHFVCVEQKVGDYYLIMDPLHGDTVWLGQRYSGVHSWRLLTPTGEAPSPPPPPPSPTLRVGLHDASGGQWMVDHGVKGACLVHHIVQSRPITLDYTKLQAANVTVICRLNWNYAYRDGTMPSTNDLEAHLKALATTMNTARGVDFFHAWNEPNNRSEWSLDHALTPQYVVDAYNTLRSMLNPGVKLALPPLDPYYGPGSNNMDWWLYFLTHASGMDAIILHGGKTQDNNPDNVQSGVKFTDDPLRWQFFHARSIEPYLDAIPTRYRNLPVFCTEVNPQRRADGSPGWEPGNAALVHEMCRYLRSVGVNAAVFYRYEPAGDQAPYGLMDRAAILEAIRKESL